MGYSIEDVGGETLDAGAGLWTADLDFSLPGSTTVTGDFDTFNFFGNTGDADDYAFSGLSDPTLGSLSFDTNDGTYVFTVDWAGVAAAGGTLANPLVVSFSVTGTTGANSDTASVQITLLICVVRGTLIMTRTGEVPVEKIAPGDMVLTMDDGFQPVRWIGCREIHESELKADESLRPIRFMPGSLGEDLPQIPLGVSPQHRMYLSDWRAQILFGEDEVLAPAKSLVNDKTVLRDHSCEPVAYYHLLFDAHQIISTNGVLTESFHPGQHSMNEIDEAARDELFRLFPELQTGEGLGPTARMALKPWEGALLSEETPQ